MVAPEVLEDAISPDSMQYILKLAMIAVSDNPTLDDVLADFAQHTDAVKRYAMLTVLDSEVAIRMMLSAMGSLLADVLDYTSLLEQELHHRIKMQEDANAND